MKLGTGRGIAADILPRLGKERVTHQKPGGLGLGISRAFQTVRSWGGDIEIKSEIGKGTNVAVTLYTAFAPKTICTQFDFPHGKDFEIYARDSATWLQCCSEINKFQPNRVRRLQDLTDLLTFSDRNGSGTPIVILNYSDDEAMNAFDVFELYDLPSDRYVIVDKIPDAQLVERANKVNARFIIKGMLPAFASLALDESIRHLDCVLIDNDPIIRQVWMLEARSHHKNILVFSHPDEFFKAATEIERRTPIFIDFHLELDVDGADVSGRACQIGFENLYIATSALASHLPSMPWIKEIRGKEPPWLETEGPLGANLTLIEES